MSKYNATETTPAENRLHLLTALEEHISRSKEIIQELSLPRYPAGGTVGISSTSRIMRHMAEADTELAGLKAQLNEHEQRMRKFTFLAGRLGSWLDRVKTVHNVVRRE